jgi:hypothetical protein
MKKIILTLAVLILAAPALGSIDITCDCNTDTNEVTVTVADSESGRPRAFALDFTASNDANIVPGSISGLNAGYGIYPGQIDINAITGEVDDYGSAVCDSGYPGTLGGLGTPGMTIEMGSLYDGEVNAPDANGVLLKFVVDVNTAIGADVNIVANAIRGGAVVMEDPDASPTVNLTGCSFITECYTGPNYGDWVDVEKPDCWCVSYTGPHGVQDYRRQCHGDACGDKQGRGNNWVATNDLNVLLDAWNKDYATIQGVTRSVLVGGYAHDILLVCADFNHDAQGRGNYRVGTDDLNILLANWQLTDGPDPNCP